MTEPLSDRLLDVCGDPVARDVVRLLVEKERSQAELIDGLGVAQATVSRAVKILRAVGLVTHVSAGRSPRLAIAAPDEANGFLLAADRLAEMLLAIEQQAQAERSRATRRGAMKATGDPASGAATEQ